jgi:hypothetical protein
MPGGTRAQLGNELFSQTIFLPAVTFPTLGANASADNTAACKGVLPGDLVSWNMQNPTVHLILDNIFVSAVDVLTIRWSTDGTGVTGATVALLLEVTRPENSSLGITNLPNNVQ